MFINIQNITMLYARNICGLRGYPGPRGNLIDYFYIAVFFIYITGLLMFYNSLYIKNFKYYIKTFLSIFWMIVLPIYLIRDKLRKRNLYNKFEKFVIENSTGEKLPLIKDIKNALYLTEKERKKLYETGLLTELLIKENGRYKLNVKYVPEKEKL